MAQVWHYITTWHTKSYKNDKLSHHHHIPYVHKSLCFTFHLNSSAEHTLTAITTACVCVCLNAVSLRYASRANEFFHANIPFASTVLSPQSDVCAFMRVCVSVFLCSKQNKKTGGYFMIQRGEKTKCDNLKWNTELCQLVQCVYWMQ